MKHFTIIFILILLAFVTGAHTASAAVTLQKPMNRLGMVGYWSFDGTDVTDKVYDRSGQGNNGYFNGGATSSAKVMGKVGQAMQFDGVNDYVSIADPGSPNSLDFQTGDSITIGAWINVPSFAAVNKVIVQNGCTDLGCGGSGTYGLQTGQVCPTTACHLIFFYRNTADTMWVSWEDVTNSIPANTWTHVSVTYTFGTGSSIKTYVNGVLQTGGSWIVGTGNEPIPNTNTSQLWIAANSNGEDLAGKIDDVRIYNRALSPGEVKALFNSGQAKFNASQNNKLRNGLVGLWSFDAADINWGTGKVLDRSGNGNDGGMSGLATTTATAIGKIGQAFKFDGVDDYINAGSAASLDNITNLTACAWTNENGHSAYGAILSKHEWELQFSNVTDFIHFERMTSGAPGGWETSNPIKVGEWFHVCVTYNSSSITNDPAFYINGELAPSYDTNVPTGTASSDASSNLIIAQWSGTNDDQLNGAVDEARIYNRALSATEVKQLYNLGAAKMNVSQNNKLTSGLIGLWSFNGPDVNWATGKVLDRSGSGKNGDMTTGFSTSTTPVMGKIGQAFRFVGLNKKISLGNGSPLDPVVFTFSTWINSASSSNMYSLIFKPANGDTGYETGWSVFETEEGRFAFRCGDVAGAPDPYLFLQSTTLLYSPPLQKSYGWHFVTVTDDGTTARLYVDGVEEASGNSTACTQGIDFGALISSNINDFGMGTFEGILDEIRLYNRALSATEVKQLYQMGK